LFLYLKEHSSIKLIIMAKRRRLSERKVQNVSLDHLKKYYKFKHNERRIYNNIEERTKKEYGMKRADGLLAYKLNKKKAYVISMEAKSHKTLPALKPYRVNNLWLKDGLWKGLLFTIITGVIFFVWKGDGVLERLVFPLGVWIGATLLHMLIFQRSYKYQEMEVIHQVFQYPANEQWLALSDDSFEMIDPALRMNLFKICKARDIGVIMVDRRKRAKVIHPARSHRKFWGDYLMYYHNEIDIRRYLDMKLPKRKKKKKKRKKKKTLKSIWN